MSPERLDRPSANQAPSSCEDMEGGPGSSSEGEGSRKGEHPGGDGLHMPEETPRKTDEGTRTTSRAENSLKTRHQEPKTLVLWNRVFRRGKNPLEIAWGTGGGAWASLLGASVFPPVKWGRGRCLPGYVRVFRGILNCQTHHARRGAGHIVDI